MGNAVQAPAASGLIGRTVYAPAALDSPSIAGNGSTPAFSAFETGVICTPVFTVPASGAVLVRLSGVFATSALQIFGLGLVPTGGSALTGDAITVNPPADAFPFTFDFPLSGLTPGAHAQFDLAGAMTGTATTLQALCVQSVSPIVASQKGGPLIMSVYLS